ncbi:hypothetical protein PVAND_015432 [Polypedilum vanderplanki]|uniref:Uncharacterized protein n=1 Tax=Polypedilum vanderplanki TaxID=319348 RepID=A0A9J6BC82_POLVA|nr:hypothetical protein PVAND_015432 [Polypedilum vanderplanki]
MEKNIIYSGEYEKKLENISFGEFILESLNKGGYREFLINGETGQIWTYVDALRETKKIANCLYSFGIKRNDKIAIISENRHEIAAIHLASFCLNSIVAPINFSYTSREIKHALKLSQPRIVFVSNLSATPAIDAYKGLDFVEKIVHFDKLSSDDCAIALNDFVAKYKKNNFNLEEIVNQPIDIYSQSALIYLSSGTTGLPKGCELTQGNVFFTLRQYIDIQETFEHFQKFNRILNIAPWFHLLGFGNLFFSVISSQFANVYLSKFCPMLFLRTIEKYKIISMVAPPPIVLFLAKHPLVDQFNLSSLRYLTSGGAPLGKEVENEIKSRFKGNLHIFQLYGMTEILAATVFFKIENSVQQSVGIILKGVYAKVIDSNGVTLGPNKVGELCFKGPNVMKGYVGDPKATTETIDKDGWLHTGDLGYYDENFYFFIVDRLKELIKYKGFQIAPAEIEALLLSHPKIKDAGVIGIPNDVAGELPFAFVVKQPNIELTEDEVKDFIAQNASKEKWLRGGVKFIEEVPKNPSGKILRRELRETYKTIKSNL